jgi:hypothetical protein
MSFADCKLATSWPSQSSNRRPNRFDLLSDGHGRPFFKRSWQNNGHHDWFIIRRRDTRTAEEQLWSVFQEVRFGTPTGASGEMIITGTIKSYNRGNRTTRYLLPGADAASFDANVIFQDGLSQKILLSASIDKFWAWGLVGASKGVEDTRPAT